MSSTEQAFVSAFARRNRNVDKPVESVARSSSGSSDRQGRAGAETRVVESTNVWVDPVADQVVRADAADNAVAKPHFEPERTKVDVDVARDVAALLASIQTIDTIQGTMPSSSTLQWVQATGIVTADEFVSTPSPEVAKSAAPVIAPIATNAHRPVANFQAAWEVDVFDVPKTVADLFFSEHLFQDLSDRMSDAVRGGMRTMLVTSAKPGEGRSSVAIGIALAAGSAGIRVALVDADLDEPTLADDLRLELEHGWLDTFRNGMSIKEIAVHAVEDAVTLIPLVGCDSSHPASADEVAQLIETLRDRFDLVVIDGPSGNSANLQPFAASMDSAIIVRDVKRTQARTVEDFANWLSRSGVQGVGLVENFAN